MPIRLTRLLAAIRNPVLAAKPTKMALEHYQQTKNVLMSHSIDPLGFF